MNKKVIITLVIILALIAGAWWMFSPSEEAEEPTEEAEEPTEEVEEPSETEDQQPVEDEEESPEDNASDLPETGTEEEDETDKEGLYATAETVEPIQEKNVAMHEDFSEVLGEVFEEEPKLVETGGIDRVSYVTNRVITSDDVMEIKDLLAEKGYETRNSSTEGDKYQLDLSISEDVLEEKYNGDPGGNMYFKMWTAEEGENAQRIKVLTL